MKKSPFRFGTKLLASATLLVVPAVAVAWLSPGLLTASTGTAATNWLAFDVPEAPLRAAQEGPQVDPSESLANDWGYTKLTKQQKRRMKAEKALLKAIWKSHIASLKLKLEAGLITKDQYKAMKAELKNIYITDRNALIAFQKTPGNEGVLAPVDLLNPPNMSKF